MQIHELPRFTETPTDDYQFAMDSGTNTYSFKFPALAEAIITAATTTINGAVQTVKAAIEAVTGRVSTLETDKLGKTGDSTLVLSGSVPRVSVAATNVAARFVASDNSDLTGLWDEKKNNWIISRNADGKTNLPGYWTRSTAGSTSTNFYEVIRNNDGIMIINMRVTVNVAINAASGGIYYGTASLPNFPVAFAETPTVTYSTESGGSIGNAWVWGRTGASTTNPGGVYLGRGSSTAANNYVITVHAIGHV